MIHFLLALVNYSYFQHLRTTLHSPSHLEYIIFSYSAWALFVSTPQFEKVFSNHTTLAIFFHLHVNKVSQIMHTVVPEWNPKNPSFCSKGITEKNLCYPLLQSTLGLPLLWILCESFSTGNEIRHTEPYLRHTRTFFALSAQQHN